MGLWGYNTYVLPIILAFLPWNWSPAPVAAMLFYQYIPKVNPWIKATIYSIVASFVMQPLFAWIGCYDPKVWKDFYSVPFFILIYMAGYCVFQGKSFAKINMH